jgi:hypothetical protein
MNIYIDTFIYMKIKIKYRVTHKYHATHRWLEVAGVDELALSVVGQHMSGAAEAVEQGGATREPSGNEGSQNEGSVGPQRLDDTR